MSHRLASSCATLITSEPTSSSKHSSHRMYTESSTRLRPRLFTYAYTVVRNQSTRHYVPRIRFAVRFAVTLYCFTPSLCHTTQVPVGLLGWVLIWYICIPRSIVVYNAEVPTPPFLLLHLLPRHPALPSPPCLRARTARTQEQQASDNADEGE